MRAKFACRSDKLPVERKLNTPVYVKSLNMVTVFVWRFMKFCAADIVTFETDRFSCSVLMNHVFGFDKVWF